jgi:hypothetical protein
MPVAFKPEGRVVLELSTPPLEVCTTPPEVVSGVVIVPVNVGEAAGAAPSVL